MRAWLGIAGGVVIWAIATQAHAAPSTIFFQELLWSGSDRSAADEWFELGSTSLTPVDLTGWRVSALTTKGEVDVAILDGLLIAPGGSVLIANNGERHRFAGGESALATAPDLIVNSLSLSNSQLKLLLYQPDGSLADVAGNGRLPLAGSTHPPTSMERLVPVLAGDEASSWRSSTARRHVDEGSTVVATPDHAGRPTLESSVPPPIIVDQMNRVEVMVADPDGEDDVAAASLVCAEQEFALNDSGLSFDAVAGDRRYSTVLPRGEIPDGCEARVVDRSGLSRAAPYVVQLVDPRADVSISEVLPFPTSGDGEEFIELWNRSDRSVTLTGWQLDDRTNQGSQPWSLAAITLPPGAYRVVHQSESKLQLNNDGDEVNLINPFGERVESVTIPAAKPGQSWARRDTQQWVWTTTITPGSVNVFSSSTPAPASTVRPVTRSIADFRTRPADEPGALSGEVVALPGTVANRYGLIADETGVSQVYLARGAFTLPPLGSTVSVTGRRAHTPYARIILDDISQIVPLPTQSMLQPLGIVEALSQPSALQYVHGEMVVTRVNRQSVTATVGGRTVSVQWPADQSTVTIPPFIVAGATVRVTGILENAPSGTVLTVRSSNDLALVAPPVLVLVPVERTDPAPSQASAASATTEPSPTVAVLQSPKPPVFEPTTTNQRAESLATVVAQLTRQLTIAGATLALLETSDHLQAHDAGKLLVDRGALDRDRRLLTVLALFFGALVGYGEWRRSDELKTALPFNVDDG